MSEVVTEGIELDESGDQAITEEPGAIVDSPSTEDTEVTLEGELDVPLVGGVQKRFNELTKKRREAERDAAYWRGKAEGAAQPTPIAAPTPAEAELDPNDFDTDADYLREVAKQMRDEIRADADTVARKQQLNATQTQISESYVKARVKYADFDDVALNPELPITQSMFDAALGDNVGDILHHLGKHPDIATRISSLSPIQQAKEIGKIEDRLSKPVPSKKKTNAPDPPIILGSGGSPASKSEAEMNRDELHAKWDAERRKSLGVK